MGVAWLLLGRRKEFDHTLAQGIADQEIRFGVAELVVSVSWIGRVLGKANEVVGFNEDYRPLKLGSGSRVFLRLAKRCPGVRSFHPRPGQLADYHRQLWGLQILAHVLDQIRQFAGQIDVRSLERTADDIAASARSRRSNRRSQRVHAQFVVVIPSGDERIRIADRSERDLRDDRLLSARIGGRQSAAIGDADAGDSRDQFEIEPLWF